MYCMSAPTVQPPIRLDFMVRRRRRRRQKGQSGTSPLARPLQEAFSQTLTIEILLLTNNQSYLVITSNGATGATGRFSYKYSVCNTALSIHALAGLHIRVYTYNNMKTQTVWQWTRNEQTRVQIRRRKFLNITKANSSLWLLVIYLLIQGFSFVIESVITKKI